MTTTNNLTELWRTSSKTKSHFLNTLVATLSRSRDFSIQAFQHCKCLSVLAIELNVLFDIVWLFLKLCNCTNSELIIEKYVTEFSSNTLITGWKVQTIQTLRLTLTS